ncbi:MAG: PadR family transcriptional regulator [Gemmatimonadales bacterium]|nr:PadR family transcriptional regulator [Gemmatimonadales bacterium]NIN11259.1 PadR family transcriptional regulator [Gemmatimonadales bacterium]NIN49858.1 PadR family transcriptional regulator [Gemmatimonadales bacterium]NIP07322.1 PadR family transcriptional regulator [Gemmatimonadales bacterium]NIR03017.1 PadR family transcriptional regulator [Gemmatimonadales bacterium]
MGTSQTDLVRGTLDMLILKTLSLQPMHGLGISRRMAQITDGAFKVKPGSLFPALHRLEQEGWIVGVWGESENNRRAKYYKLTASGRRRLGEETRNWMQALTAITRILETT